MKTKERPILFNGDGVHALLDGLATMTRRVMKPQPGGDLRRHPDVSGWISGGHHGEALKINKCPYGKPGDRLWVRETWGMDCRGDSTTSGKPYDPYVLYRAHDEPPTIPQWETFKWKPPIYMPRWASRILLEITDVRVERVQDITEAGAIDEGVWPKLVPPDGGGCPHVEGFIDLWDSINGAKPGRTWVDNPWVWVVIFKVIEGMKP